MYHGRSPGSVLAGGPRSPGFTRAAGTSQSPSDALSAVASQGALVPRVGGSIRDTCSGSSPVFGRVLFGVVRSPPRSTRVRGVVGPGEVAAHQSSRDDIIGHHVTVMCDNSTVVAYVNKQGGTVSRALCLLSQPPSEMDGESRHPSRCEVSSRTSHVLADLAGKS